MKRLLYVLLSISILITSGFAVIHGTKPRVLVLLSYGPFFPAYETMLDGYRDVFGHDVDVFVEYMDTKRIFTEPVTEEFAVLLQMKLAEEEPYDVIMTMDDNALQFALDHRRIFGEAPIVFAGVNDKDRAHKAAALPDVTGVMEKLSIRETVYVAMNLNPSLERLVVVYDDTTTGKGQWDEFLDQSQPFSSQLEIVPVNFSQHDQRSFIGEMSQYGERDAIILLSAYLAQDGQRYTFGETLSWISENTQAPIYHLWWHGLGDGILGGKVISHYEMARLSSQMAYSIIHGADPMDVDMATESPNVYAFDQEQLDRFHYDIDWLEERVEVINARPSFLESDLFRGIAAAGLVTIGIVVVGGGVYRVLLRSGVVLKKKRVDKMLGDAVSALSEPVFVMDESFMYQYANVPFLNLMGLEDQSVENRDVSSLFPAKVTAQLHDIHRKAMGASKPYDRELVMKLPSKPALHIAFHISKFVGPEDEILLIGIARDVTKEKMTERKMAEMNQMLEQQVRDRTSDLIQAEKMALMGTLVAEVSHEINTPIGLGITASSFLSKQSEEVRGRLLDGALTKKELVGFLDTVDESSEIMMNNLNNAAELVENFKKVAVDNASEEIRELGLKEYLNKIVLNLKPRMKHTNHKIRVTGAADVQIYTYPGALTQVFTNLIINSLVHGFEGKESGEIRIDFASDVKHGNICIEYQDDGVGIEKANLLKIFDPFYTTKRGQGGSGLGMNIVQNLIESRLGGSIKVYSEVGEGVRFVITLPHRVNVYENAAKSRRSSNTE